MSYGKGRYQSVEDYLGFNNIPRSRIPIYEQLNSSYSQSQANKVENYGYTNTNGQ